LYKQMEREYIASVKPLQMETQLQREDNWKWNLELHISANLESISFINFFLNTLNFVKHLVFKRVPTLAHKASRVRP
jgi:hypothetical protein